MLHTLFSFCSILSVIGAVAAATAAAAADDDEHTCVAPVWRVNIYSLECVLRMHALNVRNVSAIMCVCVRLCVYLRAIRAFSLSINLVYKGTKI